MYEFSVLDYRQPDELAISAGHLIFDAIYKDDPNGYQSADDYIANIDLDIDTHYALTRTGSGLLAAAAVIHDIDHLTEVSDLAVNPDARDEGHGRRLMKHIARSALDMGDDRMRLYALQPGFFAKLGFTPLGAHGFMVATPEVVLNS